MARKLPVDFDPEGYRANYPDVALSGLTPAEHYLRFGRMMGRRFTPTGERPLAATPEQVQSVPEAPRAEEKAELKPAPAKDVAPPKDEKPKPKPVDPGSDGKPQPPQPRPKQIIDRPADFEPEQAIVRPAPPKAGADKEGRLSLATLAKEAPEASGLAAYRRMFGLKESGSVVWLGAAQLLDGAARIENAWLTADGILRLMIADHAGDAAGWAIRAYQPDQADPAQLHLLGPAALLPQRGPALVECQVENQLMPLLLELSDAEGAIKEIALMPFPSLLPGGLHNAELRALQSGPNPMEAFWVTSDLYLRELVGGPDATDLSVSRITRAGSGAPNDAIDQWLRAVFGFRTSDADGNSLERSGGGAELKLPADCIPTIGSLVSRSLSGSGTGPWLVTDSESLRPRWSVVLPASWDADGSAPVLVAAAGDEAPSVHLAIALRAPPVPALPTAPAPKKRRSTRKISVLLDAADPDRSHAAIAALSSAIGSGIDLLVRLPPHWNDFEAAIDSAWKRVDRDLQTAAAQAKHELLLTISDRVELADGAVLDTLATLLQGEGVASASCVLLREVSLKKQKVLQPATGGLFPAGVSFASAPSLTFAEPDVLEALPDAVYPVVANSFHLTLWRRSALASLPSPLRPLPASAADIHIGLALAERGLFSLCTTKVSAKLTGEYTPRDAIDPIGQSRLAPSDWQQLLGRVTLLRQLF
jgi:hypothetical protein